MSTYDRIIFLADLQYIYLWTQNSNWKNYLDLETGKVREFYFYRERQLPWGLWRTFGFS
jgi:hypothetical protein